LIGVGGVPAVHEDDGQSGRALQCRLP